MTSQPENIAPRPPRFAAWLIRIFSPPGSPEAVAGDPSRQALRTIPYLLAEGFRTAPWTIAALVTAAFLLRWYVSMITGAAINDALDAALTRLHMYDADDPRPYLFWLTTSMLLIRWIQNALVGAALAAIAKGREMVATISLAAAGIVLAVPSIGVAVARTGDFGVLRTLSHALLFSVTIVLAGALVKTLRSRATTARVI